MDCQSSHHKQNRTDMKLRLILLTAGIALSSMVSAQNQTPDSTANDTIDVVITPKRGQDSTIVQLGKMRIIVLNDKSGNSNVIVDTEAGSLDGNNENSETQDQSGDDISHWAGIRFGVNGYLVNNGLPIPASHDFLELDYGSSVVLDLNLFEQDFGIYKQYIEIVTGVGFRFATYSFKSPYTTLLNTEPLSAAVDSSMLLTRNKLKATYVTLPLLLGFSTHKDESKAFRLAGGVTASWRVGSRLKQRYSFAGETYKPVIRSNFDLNPFLFHAMASIGYGNFSLVCSYGLNTLFEKGKTIPLRPVDLGLQLMF
ncbi:MAG: hypothetical protein Kow0075_02950 [Salibacteraceae bacterium]